MKKILVPLSFFALLVLILFGPAGRLDLPFFWAFIGIYFAMVVTLYFFMDPELRRERLRPAPGGKDRHFRWIMSPLILANLAIAGLDVGRFHWSDTVPLALQFGGLAGFVFSLALSFWAASVNRFFSPVVRIQEERGHHLITAGPYRFIRHPGYLGAAGATIGASLALGSWLTLVPGAAMVLLLLRRTAMEDRFLKVELEGYADYAERVRFRWVPFLW